MPRVVVVLFTAMLLVRAFAVQAAEPAVSYRVALPLLSCPGCVGQPDPLAYAREAIRLINIERTRVGCPVAGENAILMRATQDWSEYMRRNNIYRHAGPGYYASYGYPANAGGFENLASAALPEQVVSAWMESPTHRYNMLYCEEKDPNLPFPRSGLIYDLGVGVAGGYWTMRLGFREP